MLTNLIVSKQLPRLKERLTSGSVTLLSTTAACYLVVIMAVTREHMSYDHSPPNERNYWYLHINSK